MDLAFALAALLCDGAAPSLSARPDVHRCTKMDCSDRLTIRLRASDGSPTPELTIDLDLDGTRVSCIAPARQDGEPRPCGGQNVAVTRQEVQHCRAAGCRGTGAFEDAIEVTATPRRVRVQVSQGGRLLGETSFLPRYARVRPNGRGCPPVCRQAAKIWRYRRGPQPPG
jgi:hypothetical protein